MKFTLSGALSAIAVSIAMSFACQTTSPHQRGQDHQDIMKSTAIRFTGSLTAMPSEAPKCGDMKIAVAYRFRVEQWITGKADTEMLAVLIPCPDLKGDGFFSAGAHYRIEATNDLTQSRSYTIYNDYPDSALFWNLEIDRFVEKGK
ncbi:hypothetical protein [Caballeronia glathei]|nr:hypothetical protein [Caballeronia glathei]